MKIKEFQHKPVQPDTYEASMALNQLMRIAKCGMKLHNMINNDAEMESWVAKKIDLAGDYVKKVYNYTEADKAGLYDDGGMSEMKKMPKGTGTMQGVKEDAGEKIANMAQNMTRDEFMSNADELGLTPKEAAEYYEKMQGGAYAHKFEDAGEGHMSKSTLYHTVKYAIQLMDMIKKGDDLEGWVQSKLNKAADYLQGAANYEEYQRLNPYREELDNNLMQKHAEVIQKNIDEILARETKLDDIDTKPGMMRILSKRVNEVEKEIAKETRKVKEQPNNPQNRLPGSQVDPKKQQKSVAQRATQFKNVVGQPSGSAQQVAKGLGKAAQGQRMDPNQIKQIAPYAAQLQKILADPQLAQRFRQLLMVANKRKPVTADVHEDGHMDVPSAIRNCETIIEDAMQMKQKLETMQGELPSWMTQMIAVAASDLNDARDYLLNPTTESGIMYRAGVKKYGKKGMTAIQSAAGKGASHQEIGKIKDKYVKDDEQFDEGLKDWAKGLMAAGVIVGAVAGMGSINDAIDNSVPAIKAMNTALEMAQDSGNDELAKMIEKDLRDAKLRLDTGKDLNQVKFLQDKYSKFMPTEGLAYESKLAVLLNQRLK